MRRIFWLALGLGAGATAAFLAARWMKKQAQTVPAQIARQASEGLRDAGTLAMEAFSEFRRGMAEKEAEVRASLVSDG